MTARQFFQRSRVMLFVVAGLLLIYSNGSYLTQVSGVPFVKEGAFLLALTTILFLNIALFTAMFASMKARRKAMEGAPE